LIERVVEQYHLDRMKLETLLDQEPNLSPAAEQVLRQRYYQREEGVVIEDANALFRRVASAVAQAEGQHQAQHQAQHPGQVSETADLFYKMMRSLVFLPNSPTLMNAGLPRGQLSACFVLPVEDSVPDIFKAVGWAAQIQSTGGGTGFSFSRLRPSGDTVTTTQGNASGPISFIDVFDAATHAIEQGGRRRGANMAILRVDHPDILEFITVKLDPQRWENFNVSVGITDEFMHAVRSGTHYALKNPRNQQAVKTLDARRVFTMIAQAACTSAEPGLVFLDRINAENPTPLLGTMESTNPCAELPLLPFESCNLGSINISKFVMDGAINFDLLRPVIHHAVRFLDNIIDINHYPLPEVEAITLGNRKIGLGIMGWADALIELNLSYASSAAEQLGQKLMRFFASEGHAASTNLATSRGSFPNFMQSRFREGAPLRHATVTAIAPTGTISLIADCSSGIEPLFGVAYQRRALEDADFKYLHPKFISLAQQGGWFSDALLKKVQQTGRVTHLRDVPEDVRRVFVTAADIAPEWHVRMQAAFQRSCDNAVSKTVNLPQHATPDDVAKILNLAYDLGCKGITVYRDQSRTEQVLSLGVESKRPSIPTKPCPECGHNLSQVNSDHFCTHCGFFGLQ